MQQLLSANFDDSLKCRRQIAAIAIEHRRTVADRRLAQR